MWIVNVVLIFAAIAVVGWLLWNYGDELTNALGVLFTGGQSILLALGVLLIEALKAALISALIGVACGLVFKVAGAPDPTTKAAAISIAALVFAGLMLRALWDIFTNLRRRIRHELHNRYRKR